MEKNDICVHIFFPMLKYKADCRQLKIEVGMKEITPIGLIKVSKFLLDCIYCASIEVIEFAHCCI